MDHFGRRNVDNGEGHTCVQEVDDKSLCLPFNSSKKNSLENGGRGGLSLTGLRTS